MALRRQPSDRPRVLRKDRTGPDPFRVGAVILLVAAFGTYLGFTKHIPFTHGFRVKAVFASANSIRTNSPVRIAGVNVGKVTSVDPAGGKGSTTSVVTMEIQDKGLPIHKDATLKIRPRIFLEGNFFVDLSPGTPGAPTIGDGDTLPITQTATPVQLDQVLTALQSDTRQELQAALAGYGTALTYQPTARDDRTQDPAVRGKTAAQAFNQAFSSAGPAFKATAIVNDALLGTQPHDVSRLIRGLGRTTTALDSDERALQDLVTNFNVTVAALASRHQSLQAAIRLLGPTLVNAHSALADLNRAFPPTRALAREILPGVRETPATINAAFPWVAQTRRLLGASELRGVARQLSPATASLAGVTDATIQLLPQADLVAKCATDVLLPAGDIKIQDGSLTTGAENYKEFWYTLVGLSGESQNMDGNGQYVRFQPGGGDQTVSTGHVGGAAGDVLFGNALSKPIGTRPKFPGRRPPYNSTFPCYKNKLPDLNGAATGPADGSAAATAAQRSIVQRATSAAQAPSGGLEAQPGSLTAELVARLNPFRNAGGQP